LDALQQKAVKNENGGGIVMRISRTVMAVGGVVLAAAMIGFTNPKAVHAVTAALVQVTNTASNPAVTQSVGAQAGNMVHLSCTAYMEFGNAGCAQVSADGSAASLDYTVPVGESLVITSVDLAPKPGALCANDYSINLRSGSGFVLTLATTNSLATTHFTYPSGLVIGGGVTPTVNGYTETPTQDLACNAYDEVNIYGYLTAS
jgi:hypothetical protein